MFIDLGQVAGVIRSKDSPVDSAGRVKSTFLWAKEEEKKDPLLHYYDGTEWKKFSEPVQGTLVISEEW